MAKEKTKSLAGSRHKTAEASSGFLFWKTYNCWTRLLRVELEKIGLTQVQYSIMAATNYLGSVKPSVSQQDISTQLGMDKMMVSDVVKTLERKSLLLRRPNPSDGRSVQMELTAAGKALLRQAVPVVEEVDEKFFGGLAGKELRAFQESLKTLSAAPKV